MIPMVRAIPVTLVEADGMEDAYLQAFLDAAEHIRVELRVVTPQWAREVLDTRNGHNRKLSLVFRKLATVMSLLHWEVNGACLVFDRSGRLANGQHRLNAVVSYGKPVPMMVIYGVTDLAFDTHDLGLKKRTNADILGLMGKANCTALASALGWMRAAEMGEVGSTKNKSVPYNLMTEMVEDYPGISESVTFASGCKSKLIPPGLLAWLHYEFNQKSPEQATAFFHRVAKRLDIQEPSHEHLLVRRLEDMQGDRSAQHQVHIAAITIKTWNRIRGNEPVSTAKKAFISWKSDQGEPFPEIV